MSRFIIFFNLYFITGCYSSTDIQIKLENKNDEKEYVDIRNDYRYEYERDHLGVINISEKNATKMTQADWKYVSLEDDRESSNEESKRYEVAKRLEEAQRRFCMSDLGRKYGLSIGQPIHENEIKEFLKTGNFKKKFEIYETVLCDFVKSIMLLENYAVIKDIKNFEEIYNYDYSIYLENRDVIFQKIFSEKQVREFLNVMRKYFTETDNELIKAKEGVVISIQDKSVEIGEYGLSSTGSPKGISLFFKSAMGHRDIPDSKKAIITKYFDYYKSKKIVKINNWIKYSSSNEHHKCGSVITNSHSRCEGEIEYFWCNANWGFNKLNSKVFKVMSNSRKEECYKKIPEYKLFKMFPVFYL